MPEKERNADSWRKGRCRFPHLPVIIVVVVAGNTFQATYALASITKSFLAKREGAAHIVHIAGYDKGRRRAEDSTL